MNVSNLFRTACAAVFLAAASAAQDNPKPQDILTEQRSISRSQMLIMQQSGPGAAGAPGAFAFVTATGAEQGPLVKNAPYSAESITETTRTLADGTRLQSKLSASLARDKDGRTRRETSFEHIGPWSNPHPQPPRFATITDPHTKEVVILNLTDRSAVRAKAGEPMIFRHESASGNSRTVTEQRVQINGKGAPATGPADVLFHMPVAPPGAPFTAAQLPFDPANTRTESLGRQTMEGVLVEGTRTTHTIPTGQIGNDRPLVTVTEKWVSPELQITVFSRTTDPQVGETIYRLSNLRRGEPDPALFRIPADFRLQEAPAAGGRRVVIGKQ